MLRLEHLFDRLGQLIAREAPVDHHFALATMFEIMDVGLARRPQVRPAEGAREAPPAAARLPRQPGDLRGRARRASSPASTTPSDGLNQLAGKAGAGADEQRMADEHPQPHQHSRRHLRVRPAGLLRLAAARPAPPPRRPAAAGSRSLMPLAEALQVLLGLLRDSRRAARGRRHGGQYQQSLPRAASTSCCACASTRRCSSCPRSAATG